MYHLFIGVEILFLMPKWEGLWFLPISISKSGEFKSLPFLHTSKQDNYSYWYDKQCIFVKTNTDFKISIRFRPQQALALVLLRIFRFWKRSNSKYNPIHHFTSFTIVSTTVVAFIILTVFAIDILTTTATIIFVTLAVTIAKLLYMTLPLLFLRP